MHQRNLIETVLEQALFKSRWLLAPFYLGLVAALAMLLAAFVAELLHAVPNAMRLNEVDPEGVILATLGLIDLSLAGNLVVIVIFSGYENFVSRIDTASEKDTLGWLGKLDSGTLKLKVAASIVAISSIHLLRIFMKADETENDKIMWYVILHLTFVVSAVLLGVLDRMSFAGHREK